MGLHVCLDGRSHSPPPPSPAPALWSLCSRRLPLTPCDCPQGQRVGWRALPTGASLLPGPFFPSQCRAGWGDAGRACLGQRWGWGDG